MSVNGVIVASTAADGDAVEMIKSHHAQLAGHLVGVTDAMLSAAERPSDFEAARSAAVAFLTSELLPHAAAEEERLYPAAARTDRVRPLIESMIAAHRVIAALADRVRNESTPLRAAAAGHALRVLFEAHLADENERILPVVAADPDVSLADVTHDMHELLGGHSSDDAAGHQCSCGEADGGDPVLDVRDIPHSIRHATVFGAFDAVPAGGTLVLVAHHDPLPLLSQLRERTGGGLAVDYAESGPDVWRLRLTRN
jgi:uncharacterized protein (DUF2249 family)